MDFCKWTLLPIEDTDTFSTPEHVINQRGGSAWGIFFLTDRVVVGCISDGADISGLEAYNIEKITRAEAEGLLYEIRPTSSISHDGYLWSPVQSA